MSVRKVLVLPDPALQHVTHPIKNIGPDEVALARDLVDTMQASPACVGLAANQIGIERQAFCIDVTGHKKADSCNGLVVLFNPELILAQHYELGREGCMSVPDLTGNVSRAIEVVVRGITPEGIEREIEANAIEARAILHELDHLAGKVFLDRVQSFAADVFKRKRYR